MTFARRVRSLFAFAADRANPLLVREVRRTFRGRLFPLGFMAALLLCLVIAVFSVEETRIERRGGLEMFTTIFIVYNFFGWFVVPLFGFRWIFEERRDDTYPILAITTIGPWRLVTGRFWGGCALLVMIAAALAPFVTYAYLLRGLDILDIVVYLGSSTAISLLLLGVGIFLSGIPSSRQSLFLVGLPFVGGILSLLAAGSAAAVESLQRRSFFAGATAPMEILGVVLVVAVPLTVFFALAARATLAPAATNYAVPVRLAALGTVAVWLAGGIVFERFKDDDLVLAWSVASIALVAVVGIGAAGEPEQLSHRIRLQAARVPSRVLRALAVALVWTGRGTGFFFVLASLAGIVAIHALLLAGVRHVSSEASAVAPVLASYVVIYLGLSLLLMRRVFPAKSRTPRNFRAMPFIVIGISSFIAAIPYIDPPRGGIRAVIPSDFFNPVLVLSKWTARGAEGATLVVGILAVLAIAANLDLVLKSFRQAADATSGGNSAS